MDEDGGNAADDADDALRVTARILSDGDDDPDGGRDHDDVIMVLVMVTDFDEQPLLPQPRSTCPG